jgi:hypothetical protein
MNKLPYPTTQTFVGSLRYLSLVSWFLGILVFSLFTLYLSTSLSNASEWDYVSNRQLLSFDEPLSDQTQVVYKEPEKIIISQITTQSDVLSMNSKSWIQTLYYYSITRLGFADIPYNFLIDREGNIYQGRSGYAGAVPELQNLEGVILIGYLSNTSDFTSGAQMNTIKLITDLSKAFGIPKSNVNAVFLDIVKGTGYNLKSETSAELVVNVDTPKLSKLVYSSDITSPFSTSLTEILNKSTFYSERQNPFVATVTDVKTSTETVEAGKSFDVGLTVTNTNSFPWFLEDKYLYISTKSGKNSEYAVNGTWDSFSKPTHFTGEVVLPNQKLEMRFAMQTPDYPNANGIENFIITVDPGIDITGTDFAVKIDVTKGTGTFVQIQPTEAGVLNVRSCDYIGCDVVAQVPVGKIYRVLEESNGWYKIPLGDGSTGWVGGAYAKPV